MTRPDDDLPTPITRQDWLDAADWAAAKAARRDPDADMVHVQARMQAEEAAWVARWNSIAPSRFAGAHVDQLDGDLAQVAVDWDGQNNILLLGDVGVGKTHAALAIARKAFEDGTDVQFRPAVELLDDLRPGGPERTMESAVAVPLLVLDDLGSERPSDWTGERLYRLVNRRWLECRPTIATANLPSEQLRQALGARLWSRLFHQALAIEVAGDDRRAA